MFSRLYTCKKTNFGLVFVSFLFHYLQLTHRLRICDSNRPYSGVIPSTCFKTSLGSFFNQMVQWSVVQTWCLS